MKILTIDRLIEIGKEIGLKNKTLEDFVEFFSNRFSHNINRMETGYEIEWANRFKQGDEWNCGDFGSRVILKEINPDKYGV